MRAILLAAGLGTRLRPLTDSVPKCLVPIKGVPLLEIWLDKLSDVGTETILVNTHYLAAKVVAYVENSNYKHRVEVVYEPHLLGTAGTLMANLAFFEGYDGILAHADNYFHEDLSSLVAAHKMRSPGCVITMLTFRTETPSTCGIVEVDELGVVTGFHEKVMSPPSNLANGAVYLLSSELLARLPLDWQTPKDFSVDILATLVGRIQTYETKKLFLDIGTPSAYVRANMHEKVLFHGTMNDLSELS